MTVPVISSDPNDFGFAAATNLDRLRQPVWKVRKVLPYLWTVRPIFRLDVDDKQRRLFCREWIPCVRRFLHERRSTAVTRRRRHGTERRRCHVRVVLERPHVVGVGLVVLQMSITCQDEPPTIAVTIAVTDMMTVVHRTFIIDRTIIDVVGSITMRGRPRWIVSFCSFSCLQTNEVFTRHVAFRCIDCIQRSVPNLKFFIETDTPFMVVVRGQRRRRGHRGSTDTPLMM